MPIELHGVAHDSELMFAIADSPLDPLLLCMTNISCTVTAVRALLNVASLKISDI